MKTINSILLIVFCAAAPLAGKAEVKTATVERLLEREFVGNVLIDDKRGKVYFERVEAKGSSSAKFPYTDFFGFSSALKKIYTAPLDGVELAEPLFRQDEAKGYFFASDDPWSPDKRYIAIYRFYEGRLQPGVYDLIRSKEKFFNIEVTYDALRSSLVWTSDREFVVPDRRNVVKPFLEPHFGYVYGARAIANARESAWRDGKVTADVTGAGKYANPQVNEREFKLAKVNVRSGDINELSWRSVYRRALLRISRPATLSNRIAVAEEILVKTDPAKDFVEKSILSILDASTEERKTIIARDGESVYLNAWSGSGQYLLVRRVTKTPAGREDLFSVVNADNAAFVEDLPKGASNPQWIGDALAYDVSGKTELLTNIGIDASTERTAASDTSDRIIFEPALPSAIAVFGTNTFYLENGDIWRADLDGERVNLTGDVPPLTLYQKRFEYADHFLSLMKDSAKRYIPSLDEFYFFYEENGVREFFVFSADGQTTRVIPSPSEGSQLLAASVDGGVFLTNSYNIGSQLHYVKADGVEEPAVLYHFNKQLAGVTPAVGPMPIQNRGYDGRAVTSWLFLPPGASIDRPTQYPMVMVPYAGSVFNDGNRRDERSISETPKIWDLALSSNTAEEVYAARGYAVLLPSIPLVERGEAGEPLTRMMPAVLSALDAAIETGFVDSTRLAVSGHSYGGYSALSIAAQTDRFHAIIAAAPSANIISEFGQFAPSIKVNADHVTPPGGPWTEWAQSGQGRMGAAPWEDPERYVRNSPIFFADRVTTPVMLIHGGLDGAAIPANSEEMFTALRLSGKDVLFVRYAAEEHVIQQPQNQRDMWRRIFYFLEDNGVMPGPKTSH